MDSGLISPVIRVLGVVVGGALGTTGTLVVQRLGFQRADAGIRRQIRTRLRIVLIQLSAVRPRQDVSFPTLRANILTAVEQGHAIEVAIALRDDQHFQVVSALDRLRVPLNSITSELTDRKFIGEQPRDMPSDDDYFFVDERIRFAVHERHGSRLRRVSARLGSSPSAPE